MLKMPDFKIGSDTQAVLDMMKERMHEEVPQITILEIERLTKKPIDDVRGSIHTARRIFRRDYGKWWANVRAIGYRIMADEDLHQCAKINRSKARNLHRETIKTLAIADPAHMSVEARTSVILERSIAELGLAATAPRAIARAQQMVSRSHNELTSEQQIEAIKDALKPK